MITNKDVRVENGNLVLNGDKYPLDGQSPEAIMDIVEDNSDTTPTEDSTAPITSGGVFAADKNIIDTIGDITQTGITGASVAAQISALDTDKKVKYITLDNNETATLNVGNETYWALIANCYIPGDGARLLAFSYSNGTAEVKNLWSGTTYTSANVDFTFSANSLTIGAKDNAGYKFNFFLI